MLSFVSKILSIYLFKLKQVMSSGSSSCKTWPPLADFYEMKRGLLKKNVLQNFYDISINRSININNILDAIASFNSEINSWWLSIPFLARLIPVVKDLPVKAQKFKRISSKVTVVSKKINQWIVSLPSRNANVHFWFPCILFSKNVTWHDTCSVLSANNDPWSKKIHSFAFLCIFGRWWRYTLSNEIYF